METDFTRFSRIKILEILLDLTHEFSTCYAAHKCYGRRNMNESPGEGGYSLIWAIWGRAAGQAMVFWPCCPKQGVQFDTLCPKEGQNLS